MLDHHPDRRRPYLYPEKKYHMDTMCSTCATEFPAGRPLPYLCPVCNDDRQYIPLAGQQWTSMEALSKTHTVKISPLTPELYALQVTPAFAIDQRALLLLSPDGNILWDCIPLINEPVIEFIRSKGGLKAIAISHPHYYSVMQRWAEVFDCPIYIHELERPWVYNGAAVEYWCGEEKKLWAGIKLIRTGGHFPGSSILRVPALSPNGTLLCGDSLYLSRNKRHISIMYSYPNHIPLPPHELKAVTDKVAALEFDTLYGAFPWQQLSGNARRIFLDSVKRYALTPGLRRRQLDPFRGG
jgi:glyoxylase-like metal-dependent hydrolase (beta-lactamase superfamily II)